MLFPMCSSGRGHLSGQVRLSRRTPPPSKTIDGRPFHHFSSRRRRQLNRSLAPVRSVFRQVVTRGFRLETLPGESRRPPYIIVAFVVFSLTRRERRQIRENDPSSPKGRHRKIVVCARQVDDRLPRRRLANDDCLEDSKGKTRLVEESRYTFLRRRHAGGRSDLPPPPPPPLISRSPPPRI